MAIDWLDEVARLEVAQGACHRATFLLGAFRHDGIDADVERVEAHRGAGAHIVITLDGAHQVDAWLREDGSIDEYRITARRPQRLHLDDPDQDTAVYVTRQFCGLVGEV